ncbi:S-layer homology domain-containing protein [Tumebacillus flagellatus]|uniref:SLH domain-containing protein n=1 Tax=Tumebacillus flagellatus TaxID=1157490 RepID=A0A074M9P7_9BACL|nr:S-layer homology domain-containing protein [Tumebacillus flagellatus]KEO82667.1 hypothetical protein EL26_13960 [Tumebacillus flagellatus]
MASYLKKMALILASSAVTTTYLGFASAGNVAYAADNRLSVQMVEDCDTVGAGGEIGYHTLYHNVENKNNSRVQLKVRVPEGLDVDESDADGASWDAAARMLTWNLKDVENNGARVTHFHLKVKADAEVNTSFELSCVVEEDGKWKMETPKIKCKTGTEVDQPFFVGYPDGTFHPDAPITRAELVRLVLVMRGVQEAPFTSFDDANDTWAKDFIGTANALNWVDGDGNGKFRPNDSTDRASAAKMFDIALLRGPLKEGTIAVQQHFPDVAPKSWSFGWVEEASTLAHESVHRGRGVEQLIRYLPELTKPM